CLPLPPPLRSTLFPYTTLFRSAALPERRLPQPFRDAHRLVGPLADQERPQQFDGAFDERLAGEDAADAGEARVGEDFDDGVNVRSEEHTSELQSLAYLVCRLLL